MYNPYSDWYYPTQGLQAQEQWYAEQQQYEQTPHYGGEPAPGFSNRLFGDHPPEHPISNREKQIMEQYETVRGAYAGDILIPAELRAEILAANDAVVDTLRSGPGGFLGIGTSYQMCLRYSRGDAGALLRTAYATSNCGEWDDRLGYEERRLQAALAQAGSHERAAGQVSPRGGTVGEGLAETSGSLADQSETAREQSEEIITGGERTWWDEVPEWVKKLLIYGSVGAVGLVTLRVLAPALLGTYLEDRRIRQRESRELESSGDRAVW